MDTVREDKHPCPKAVDDFAGRIELKHDRQVRPRAGVCPASLSNPNGPAIAIDINRARRSPYPSLGQYSPVPDCFVRIGEIIDRLDLCFYLFLGHHLLNAESQQHRSDQNTY